MNEEQKYMYHLENLDFVMNDRYSHNDNEEEDILYRKISIFERQIEYKIGKAFIEGIIIGKEGDSIEELAIGASVNVGSSVIDDDFLKKILDIGGRGNKEKDSSAYELINLYKNGNIEFQDLKNAIKTYIENLINKN